MNLRLVAAAALLLFAMSVVAVAVRSGRGSPEGRRATTSTRAVGVGESATPSSAPAPSRGDVRLLLSSRGVALPVRGRSNGAYRVITPCSNTAVVTGTAVAGAAVVLDPGHGGDEKGAVGPNGLTEKAVNLAVAGHARAALEREGVGTVLTRGGDYRMTLGARAEVALALRPRAFVSIHHNSEPDGPRPGPGTETYYQLGSASSKRLAGLIYEEVVRSLAPHAVAWVADLDAGAKYRRNDRGEDYYGILRRSRPVTAVLAELAFVSNAPEAALLARPDVQRVEGEAVARGIVRFLRTADPGSGYVEPYPRSSPAGPGGGRDGCVDPPL